MLKTKQHTDSEGAPKIELSIQINTNKLINLNTKK